MSDRPIENKRAKQCTLKNHLREEARLIEKVLGEKYTVKKLLAQGGTRRVYLVEWGLPEWDTRQTRVVKVDKTLDEITSSNALRHIERGYSTEHEARTVMDIREPERHNLTQVWDIDVLPNGRHLSVESYFEGVSLEERVKEKGPLNRQEFKKVFSQVIEGIRYLITEEEIYHRDLKPSNILVDESLNVRIADFANARSIKSIKEEGEKRLEEIMSATWLPSAGGHLVMDPDLIFGGPKIYGEEHELYQLGMTMTYALTGTYPVEYDPINKTGVAFGTATSILCSGGAPSKDHDKEIKKLKQGSPKWKRKALDLAYNLTRIDNSKRTKTVDNLVEQFEEKTHPGILYTLRRSATPVVVGTLAGVYTLFGVGAWHLMGVEEEPLRDQYEVTAAWDGESLKITNNIFIVDPKATTHREVDGKRTYVMYPQDGTALRVDPGQEIDTTVHLRQHPLPPVISTNQDGQAHERARNVPNLPGRVYFQNHEADDFSAFTFPADMGGFWEGSMGFFPGGEATLNAPEKEGTYPLIIEIYSPQCPQKENVRTFCEHFSWPTAGQVIAREVIPVIVGDVPPVILGGYTGGFDPKVQFHNPLKDGPYIHSQLKSGLTYHIRLASGEWQKLGEGGNSNSEYFRIPDKRIDDKVEVQVTYKGERIHKAALPVEHQKMGGNLDYLMLRAYDTTWSHSSELPAEQGTVSQVEMLEREE